MRILLLCHSFNSLTQRLFVELAALGHELSLEFDINDAVSLQAVELFEPDLIVAPFLKRAIAPEIFEQHVCMVVHPGPPGDGGPSALDWAILNGATEWGVTVLQAEAGLDAGPVWAFRSFAMRKATKSSLYRNEVTQAAVDAVLEAVADFQVGGVPVPLEMLGASRSWRGPAKQDDRAIDWQRDDTRTVLRKIASADGMPGLRDELFGEPVFLFDAHAAGAGFPDGAPGDVLSCSSTAIGRKTVDGGVWIGHVKRVGQTAIKLPAAHVFADETQRLQQLTGYPEIAFEADGDVGYLHFPFYNGAMGTQACERLLAALQQALDAPQPVLVLTGGADHWSNGLDLNLIEAAASPAEESWRNINAMDDLAETLIRATGKYIVSAVCGNAGAGGVFLARAADEVWLRSGSILNPHYKDMGNLYGSEFWTYLLPARAGERRAAEIARARLPMGASEAIALGLADRVIEASQRDFADVVQCEAAALAGSADLQQRIADKAARRSRDEAEKPLIAYRREELAHMRKNFFGFDPSYHVARYNFVHKKPKSRTPLTIARHRAASIGGQAVRRAANE